MRESGRAESTRCPTALLVDAEKDAGYHEAVDFVIENGLMTVEEGMYFFPEGGTVRLHALEMLYDLAGRPEIADETVSLPFADLRGGESYFSAVCWAYTSGIVAGFSDTFFGAYVPLQRAQFAVMLYRAAQTGGEKPESAEAAFADEVPEWAADALGWAAEQGYLSPDEEGRINPYANVTRAEFAYLLMMFYSIT